MLRTAWSGYRQVGLQWRFIVNAMAGLISFSAISNSAAFQALPLTGNLLFRERFAVPRPLPIEIDDKLERIACDSFPKLLAPTPSSINLLSIPTVQLTATQIASSLTLALMLPLQIAVFFLMPDLALSMTE